MNTTNRLVSTLVLLIFELFHLITELITDLLSLALTLSLRSLRLHRPFNLAVCPHLSSRAVTRLILISVCHLTCSGSIISTRWIIKLFDLSDMLGLILIIIKGCLLRGEINKSRSYLIFLNDF